MQSLLLQQVAAGRQAADSATRLQLETGQWPPTEQTMGAWVRRGWRWWRGVSHWVGLMSCQPVMQIRSNNKNSNNTVSHRMQHCCISCILNMSHSVASWLQILFLASGNAVAATTTIQQQLQRCLQSTTIKFD